MKNVFWVAICVSCMGFPWLANARAASAQITLGQLQQQIRQRQEQSAQQRPTQARGPTAAGQPGFLGLIADDTKDRGRGVRVTDVRAGGPVATAGIVKGDLITTIDGIRVRQMSDMAAILGLLPAGKTVVLDILRDGNKHSLKVTLGRRPTTSKPSPTGPEPVLLPPPVPTAAQPPVDRPQLFPPKTHAVAKEPVEPPPAETPSINDLLLRIEELEKRVKQLEKALAERP